MPEGKESLTDIEISYIKESIKEIKDGLKEILVALKQSAEAHNNNNNRIELLERDCVNCRERQGILISEINEKIKILQTKSGAIMRNWQSWLIIMFTAAAFVVSVLALTK